MSVGDRSNGGRYRRLNRRRDDFTGDRSVTCVGYGCAFGHSLQHDLKRARVQIVQRTVARVDTRTDEAT